MNSIIFERFRQGYRTTGFPDGPSALEGRFRGRPEIDPAKCRNGCKDCADACPTQALDRSSGQLRLDLGRCVFCPICVEACPEGAVAYTSEPAMAVTSREDLILDGSGIRLASALDQKMRSLFGRSLRLREVCAGSCNGCEAELVATGNVVFDLSRFGVQFVASPRHADGIVITGPVTNNMRHALLETWEAIPAPRIAIAVGACAISGGPFAGGPETNDGVGSLIPVDLYIPGCPPHPITILDGLLRLLGRMEERRAAKADRG